jgi:hypothetical protein
MIKRKISFVGQAQLSSGIARLNDANLRGRLEAQIWYQALNANDKTILEGNNKHRYLYNNLTDF